ncbi:MAG: hypothetical protein WBG86_16980 [Polyangiales bacterium]
MHGLRCAPTLLGWTRLLDEWVVGLPRYNRATPTDPTCWEDEASTRQTLADAAEAVQRFAHADSQARPVRVEPNGILRFELQGCGYVVSVRHCVPCRVEELDVVPGLLEESRAAAENIAQRAVAVGAVFVTPVIHRPGTTASGVPIADQFVAKSRAIPSMACAYSFPGAEESARYAYGNEHYPGALLLATSA